MSDVNWETIDRLVKATSEAREVIREAHAATKDLNQAIREARRLLTGELTSPQVTQQINEAVTAQLDKLSIETQDAMRASVTHVQGEFDKLLAIFLGKDREARQDGKQPLDDLICQYVSVVGPNQPLNKLLKSDDPIRQLLERPTRQAP